MSMPVFRAVCAGAASWPILSAALAISTGFIVTTGALGAIWPAPTHQTETLDKTPTASVPNPAPPPSPPPAPAAVAAAPAAPAPALTPAPAPVQQVAQNKIPDVPDAPDSTRDGVRKATYNPPSIISAARLSNDPYETIGRFQDKWRAEGHTVIRGPDRAFLKFAEGMFKARSLKRKTAA